MFEIALDKQADKFLHKCEKILFDRIVKKLEELALNHKEKRIVVVKIDKRERVY